MTAQDQNQVRFSGEEPRSSPEDAHRRKVAETRAMLASEFHIEAAFVGVPKLSRILGIAPSTIYGYMRRKEFFLPYRMFNTMAMVSLDDIADWLCSADGVVRAPSSAGRERPQEPPPIPEEVQAQMLFEQTIREIEEGRKRRSRGPR